MFDYENDDDFIIKIDDIETDDSGFKPEESNMKDIDTQKNDEYFMKIDNESYGKEYIENESELYAINNNINLNKELNDGGLDYNSPEYVEYISKLNKDSLNDMSMEDIDGDNSNVDNKFKGKYTKKQIQTLILGLIGILFIASLMTFGYMIKDSSSNPVLIGKNNVNKNDLSELEFLLKVVDSSNKSTLNQYDELKEFSSSNNDKNINIQKLKIDEISKSLNMNLDEVNSLKDYINTENYSTIVSLLKLRYETAMELCDKLSDSKYKDRASIYNTYAQIEIEIIESLNEEIIKKLDLYGVSYKIKNNQIIFKN